MISTSPAERHSAAEGESALLIDLTFAQYTFVHEADDAPVSKNFLHNSLSSGCFFDNSFSEILFLDKLILSGLNLLTMDQLHERVGVVLKKIHA